MLLHLLLDLAELAGLLIAWAVVWFPAAVAVGRRLGRAGR